MTKKFIKVEAVFMIEGGVCDGGKTGCYIYD